MTRLRLPKKKDIERLSSQDAKDHIEALRKEIRKHDYLYYVKNKPQICDEKYDCLFDTLKQLEEAFPIGRERWWVSPQIGWLEQAVG